MCRDRAIMDIRPTTQSLKFGSACVLSKHETKKLVVRERTIEEGKIDIMEEWAKCREPKGIFAYKLGGTTVKSRSLKESHRMIG